MIVDLFSKLMCSAVRLRGWIGVLLFLIAPMSVQAERNVYSPPIVPYTWQAQWAPLLVTPRAIAESPNAMWSDAKQAEAMSGLGSKNSALYLRTQLPNPLPEDAHLFVPRLPRCWELYIDGIRMYGSDSFGPSKKRSGYDFRFHAMIPIPQAAAGRSLVLRLWSPNPRDLQPGMMAIGSSGALIARHAKQFAPFMVLGIVLGAVGIGCLVGYTFRPHPRTLLLLGMASCSFAYISLVESGRITLLGNDTTAIGVGWLIAVLTSCAWVALLLAELLPGIIAQRLLRLTAILQWLFFVAGMTANFMHFVTAHQLVVIWQNWTVAGSLPVLGVVIIGQLFNRNRDAMIIIFVGMLPFGLIALAQTWGAPVDLVRALPWAAAALVGALAAVTVRRGLSILRQQLANQALRQSEYRMRSMLNTTHDLAVLLNRGHEMLMINDIGATRLGLSIEDALQQSILEYLPANIAMMRRTVFEQVWKESIPVRFEDEYDERIYDHHVYPIVNEQRDVLQIAVFSHDITERRKAEQALAKAQQRELETGSRIQSSLLVGHPPKMSGTTDVAAVTIPSKQIDGDFFEFLQHSESCFDVLVGDVMGKGVPAALVGAATKNQFLRALGTDLRMEYPDRLPLPREIVEAVHRNVTQEMIVVEKFATVCYARFDLEAHCMTYVDCGHTATVHYRCDTGKCDMLQGVNMPIGFHLQEKYEQHETDIHSGDVFVFYSDGVTEAMNAAEELYGEKRLSDLIAAHHDESAEKLIATIRRAITEYSGSDTFRDDLTILVIKL